MPKLDTHSTLAATIQRNHETDISLAPTLFLSPFRGFSCCQALPAVSQAAAAWNDAWPIHMIFMQGAVWEGSEALQAAEHAPEPHHHGRSVRCCHKGTLLSGGECMPGSSFSFLKAYPCPASSRHASASGQTPQRWSYRRSSGQVCKTPEGCLVQYFASFESIGVRLHEVRDVKGGC